MSKLEIVTLPDPILRSVAAPVERVDAALRRLLATRPSVVLPMPLWLCGTPRIAGRLLRRVRDFASVDGAAMIDVKVADKALIALEVDGEGLDSLDHRYLNCIVKNYDGGPVGIETLAAALSEPRDALEEIVEPYLLQQGFIGRTPRGRVLTLRAYKHLGLTGGPGARASTPQIGLFDENADDEDGGKAGTG